MPNEVEQLKERVQLLENIIYAHVLTSGYSFNRDIRMFDGKNLQFGTSTGTKIGTSASQKLGFFGHTPVIQQSAIGQASGGATVDTQARTAVNSVITTLQTLGLTQ